ncbi:flavin reductase family protein [Bacterioplanoides pacificum]|uniref:Flavin reductase family protein n=1 Tax=Bacterioplanoides pacificum TaxID=1171596 RepID=A0ABV7VSF5_9GAMM
MSSPLSSAAPSQPGRWQQAWRWFAESLTQQPRFSDYLEPLVQLLTPNWSSVYSRADVLTLRHETDDVFTLVLRPDKSWAARGFRAGQHVELICEKDGVRAHRTFSISSSPYYLRQTGLFELTIRVQQQGAITPWLRQQFSQGGLVNISAPFGDFVLSPADNGRPLLMIAGGSGITPFRSMLAEMQALAGQRQVHLLYYARDAQQWLFRQEFERLTQQLPQFSLTLMNDAEHGLLQAGHLQQLPLDLNEPQWQLMICGPTPMIQLARQLLRDAGVDDARVDYEYFGAAPIDQVAGLEGQQHISCVRSDTQLTSNAEQPQSLLDLAEQAGLKPLSGCRIGVCHQCICKKQSGVVYNTKTGQTSDSGPQEIQLCVSVPVTDVALDL